MASKRKVNLDDYQLTTTLGTGKLLRFINTNHQRFEKYATIIEINNMYKILTISITYRVFW